MAAFAQTGDLFAVNQCRNAISALTGAHVAFHRFVRSDPRPPQLAISPVTARATFSGTIFVSGDLAEWQLSNGQWTASGAAPTDLQIAGAGKFFGSTAPNDVLWFNRSTGETDIWGKVERSLGWHCKRRGSGWQVAGIGNLTGNGTDDILWHNVNSGDVAEWITQNGHYVGAVDFGAVTGWQVAGIGDFTGTGTSDVLWHTGS